MILVPRASKAIAVAVLVATGSLTPIASAQYTVIDLGTLGGAYSYARGINESGQVAGYAQDPNNSEKDLAFRTAPDSPINPATDNLGTLNGTYSYALGVNGSGRVVGYAGADGDAVYHAFRTAANSPINPATDDLGVLNSKAKYSLANAINDVGQVVGISDTTRTAFYPAHAFRTAPNSAINPATDDLGTLGGTYSEALGINDNGQVVGYADLAGDTASHAFRTAPNSAINPATDDLGTLGGTGSYARGINDSGQAVGSAQTSGNAAWHAFRTAPNSPINPATDDLGTLGGLDSHATAINNSGLIVGLSDIPGGARHAFLYSGSTMIDLNDLIDPCSGWELTAARSINDAGRITGTGMISGETHAFLLIPAFTVAMPGDFDHDCDVDQGDLDIFEGCASGPEIPYDPQDLPLSCTLAPDEQDIIAADLDRDGDVDQEDFGAFQRCLSG